MAFPQLGDGGAGDALERRILAVDHAGELGGEARRREGARGRVRRCRPGGGVVVLGVRLRSDDRSFRGFDPERLGNRPRPEAPQLVGRREHARARLEEQLEPELVGTALARLDVDDHGSGVAERETDRACAATADRRVGRGIELERARAGLLEQLIERRSWCGRVPVHAPPRQCAGVGEQPTLTNACSVGKSGFRCWGAIGADPARRWHEVATHLLPLLTT